MIDSPKKIAVILCGCGVMDGSEIHEATCTLLNISDLGAEYQCFAPDMEQPGVVNHATKHVEHGQTRNMMAEAARIARGNISPLKDFNAKEFDAVIFPGGQGAAKNLCNYISKGGDCDVLPQVQECLESAYTYHLPIGAICIAPVLVARVLGKHGIIVTIGNDEATAHEIEKNGAIHQNCRAEDICCDTTHRIVTTPAYMLAQNIAQINKGIRKLVQEILNLC